MRGKKAKEMRRLNPATPNPNRVVGRIQIVVRATGDISVRNFPADEQLAKLIMARAADLVDAHFKRLAKGPIKRGG